MTDGGPAALGPRNTEVKRLRTLLRDPAARAAESAFVLEGPRLVADALRRGAVFDAIFLGERLGRFAPCSRSLGTTTLRCST